MALDVVPEHLAVVGGSCIGLAFAQLMRQLGAAVTVVERTARLLPREDADVSDGIRGILEAEGVRFELGAGCLSLAPAGDRIVVGAACGDGGGITGSQVLLAVGPQPNSDGLGLELVGIGVDACGCIAVDDQCRTSAEGIRAVGGSQAAWPGRRRRACPMPAAGRVDQSSGA